MEVIRAGAQWKEKILRFADEVFDGLPEGGFAELIPDVYGPDAPCDKNHLLVLEEGKIQALLLTEPTSFVCGNEVLRGIGVGTVSVAEDARGRGFMQLLLKTVREWMKEEGYAFAVLAGQRQRYAYWGYEPMETRINMQLEPGNGKHGLTRACADGADAAVSFAELEEGSREESMASALFDGLPLHTLRRKEGFARHLKAGCRRPLAIRSGGAFVGYLCESVRSGEPRITELELSDPKLYPAVIKAYWEKRAPQGFSVSLAPYRTREFAFLEKVCGRYQLGTGYQYYIADLREMLSFFLRAEQRLSGLADGEWSFRIREEETEEERLFGCSVKGEQIRVSCLTRQEAGEDRWQAAEEWEKGELVRFLFGPSSCIRRSAGAPAEWFPLPLFLPEADAV